ncbi:hypothetical protein CWO85_00765 [Candidatus Phytoplasma ziziphi]|uniref:Uncharacterized protein n=1 Tax=Ziziphus jujuba witches'-broom phytoplasma TaxID=135727 RepID=A0A660HM64_ZIZJU|nr:ATP-binding protein [Candidatus Phytoplasma ziziphi]AYJ01072.1 hypothetical protein CWO85_00765 [Candidatus Phytoplasma ziziphi]
MNNYQTLKCKTGEDNKLETLKFKIGQDKKLEKITVNNKETTDALTKNINRYPQVDTNDLFNKMKTIVNEDPEIKALNINIPDFEIMKVYNYLSNRNKIIDGCYKQILQTKPFISIVYKQFEGVWEKQEFINYIQKIYQLFTQNNIFCSHFSFNGFQSKIKDHERAVTEAKNYLIHKTSNADNQKRHKGFYILGDTQTGKTLFLKSFTDECLRKQISCLMLNMQDVVRQFKNTGDSELLRIYEKKIETLKTIDVLLLDDFGFQMSPLFRDDVLMLVLNYRLENNLLTGFASSMNLGEIAEFLFSFKDSGNFPAKINKITKQIQALTHSYYFGPKK